MDSNSLLAREIFSNWAPVSSVWSQWAKPVLFAQFKPAAVTLDADALTVNWDMNWLSTLDRDHTALIVNLPGLESVAMALAVAKGGYQPVPLYNACDGPEAVVPMDRIQEGLRVGSSILHGMPIGVDAPPAFLIDSQRIQGAFPPAPGRFDNRWVVFPQDLPSGTFLRSKNIEHVIVLQHGGTKLQDDLVGVLMRWQKAGIEILVKGPTITAQSPSEGSVMPMEGYGPDQPPERIYVRPAFFYIPWYPPFRVYGMVGRRSNVGGFGSHIPVNTTRSSTYG